MACIDQKKLSAYLDGELPPEENAALEEHLARCAPCREELSRLAFVSEALEALDGVEPGPYFAPRLKRLAVGERGRGWVRRAFVPAAAAAAAALSLVLGGFLGRALYVEPNGASVAANGELVEYLGVAPVEDFPDGSLGETWGEVLVEGENG
jgi:anti-sigma factor RsiW